MKKKKLEQIIHVYVIKKCIKCPFIYQLHTVRHKYIYNTNKNAFVARITQEKY